MKILDITVHATVQVILDSTLFPLLYTPLPFWLISAFLKTFIFLHHSSLAHAPCISPCTDASPPCFQSCYLMSLPCFKYISGFPVTRTLSPVASTPWLRLPTPYSGPTGGLPDLPTFTPEPGTCQCLPCWFLGDGNWSNRCCDKKGKRNSQTLRIQGICA